MLIPAPDWSNGLSKIENVVDAQIESLFGRRRMLSFAKLENAPQYTFRSAVILCDVKKFGQNARTLDGEK